MFIIIIINIVVLVEKGMQKKRELEPVITENPGITNEDQLEKLTLQLTNLVIDAHEPKSTRWYRNYSDKAEWHYLWAEKRKRDDQLHAFLMSTPVLPYPRVEKPKEMMDKIVKEYTGRNDLEVKMVSDEPPLEKLEG